MEKKTKPLDPPRAAKKIQRAWRSYVNKKIFEYIKKVLLNKLSTVNPWKMLKISNPTECTLVESSCNMHVRFRLGGDSFPPQIYYKIYTNGPVCDVNSFAPRNYAKIKKNYPTMSLEQYKKLSKEHPLDGWYKRVDNNGWRALDNKFTKINRAALFIPSKPTYFHHKKEKREAKDAKLKKLNKLRWLQSMYKKGKEEELEAKIALNDKGLDKEALEKVLDGEAFLLKDDDELEKQAEEIIKWAQDLDFDRYADEWYFKSTIFINIDS